MGLPSVQEDGSYQLFVMADANQPIFQIGDNHRFQQNYEEPRIKSQDILGKDLNYKLIAWKCSVTDEMHISRVQVLTNHSVANFEHFLYFAVK